MIFGEKLNPRIFENEIAEVKLNCSIQNAMTLTEMPKSVKVA
jgi:hypothetical protein